MFKTDPLARLLFGISTGCMVYAIIRLMLIGIHLDNGGRNMNLLLGVSEGVWSAAGAAIASLITVSGTLFIQKRKERKDAENIKNKIDNTNDNIKNVNDDVKDVGKRVENVRDKVIEAVIVPIKSLLEKSSETKNGVDYLVQQQKINDRLKQETKKEDAGQIAKACVDKLLEENSSHQKEIIKLKQQNINLNNENIEIKNEKYNLEKYIGELEDEKNKLIIQLNEYKRKEQILDNDEYEL